MAKTHKQTPPAETSNAPKNGTETPTPQPQTAAAAQPQAAETQAQETTSLRNQLLRMAADFDNFRKRTRQEQDDMRRYGISRLLGDLLPVIDNLERALAHCDDNSQDPVVQGVRMVAKQWHDVLANYGVRMFQSEGQPFDPERHEAVGQQTSKEHAPGTVLNEMQSGYMLHERLLRPARVVVADQASGAQPS